MRKSLVIALFFQMSPLAMAAPAVDTGSAAAPASESGAAPHGSQPAALDQTLQPDPTYDPYGDVPSLYRDMGVVQRRAMRKGGRFLLSSFFSMDFSDGPFTQYSVNLNPGFAISDFFEIYFNWAPAFIVSKRSIVDVVSALELANGERASIVAARPRHQLGGEILWSPLYGKDSLGLKSIIRSDTFLKLSAAQITYDQGTGMKFGGGVGKTFFLGNWIGLRLCASYLRVQTIVNGRKSYNGVAVLELGTVGYF